MFRIAVAGDALIEIEEGEFEDGELEDFARVAIQLPVRVELADGSVFENTAFINLDALPCTALPSGPLPLAPSEEDSTLYLMDRHRELVTTRLTVEPGAAGFTVEWDADLHLESGVETLTLAFNASLEG